MKLVFTFVLVAFVVGTATAGRIVGGQFAEEKQFPYQVALFDKEGFLCGGSIIDTKWILTAAHCVVDSYPTGALRVLAGTPHLERGGKYFEPENVYPHAAYQGINHDIALIKLKEAIVYDETMQKIELIEEEIPAKTEVTISGHGRTGDGLPKSEMLKYNSMFTTTEEECNKETGTKSKALVCLNNELENGACNGDSGSPAVFNGKQVGVANFIIYRCGGVKPDGYAKVIYYADWIAETMQN